MPLNLHFTFNFLISEQRSDFWCIIHDASYRIQVNNVSVENGRVVIKETPEEIQIQDLSLCYDFKDMSVSTNLPRNCNNLWFQNFLSSK